MDERPLINVDGVPEELLSGAQGEAGAREDPHMNRIRRSLAYEIERLGMKRPVTSMAAAFPSGA